MSCFVGQACVGGGVVEELASTPPQIAQDAGTFRTLHTTNRVLGVFIGFVVSGLGSEKCCLWMREFSSVEKLRCLHGAFLIGSITFLANVGNQFSRFVPIVKV